MSSSPQKDSIRITSIRGDLAALQKSIESMRMDYQFAIEDIPSQLHDKISLIKQQQMYLSSNVERERYKKYQKQANYINSRVENLNRRLDKYIETTTERASDDRFKNAFMTLEQKVSLKTKDSRERIKKDVDERIERYKNDFNKVKTAKELRFTASLSESSDDFDKRFRLYQTEIDNTPLEHDLEMTQKRIEAIHTNIGLMKTRKSRQFAVPFSIEPESESKVQSIHQEILDLAVKLNSLETDRKTKSKKVKDIIKERSGFKDTQTVTKGDIVEWGSDIADSIDIAAVSIREFTDRFNRNADAAESRIKGLSERISTIEATVRSVDEAMDEFDSVIDQRLDEKQSKIDSTPTVSSEALGRIFDRFKRTFMEARNNIKSDLDQLKRELDEAESNLPSEFILTSDED